MKGRRSRRRGGKSSSFLLVGIVLVCFLLVGGAGIKSTAFSTATVPREATADVTIDESGAHAIDTAQSVHVNSTEALVNITNHLAQDTTVTVALRDDSTSVGDLIVNGANQGDTATFTLREGNTETVKIKIPNDSALVGQTVYYHANASATGLAVSASNRSAAIKG
ncbi:hypothetical protein [Haloarcula amylovorans]|uniref:hypothetical protein n=1 Tax=Haloarcula amylovorans TaxID=2562280 RepID=UPI001075E25E|nr:hypothetical protein [Halomicroarcula amylolytica]